MKTYQIQDIRVFFSVDFILNLEVDWSKLDISNDGRFNVKNTPMDMEPFKLSDANMETMPIKYVNRILKKKNILRHLRLDRLPLQKNFVTRGIDVPLILPTGFRATKNR